MAKTLFRKEALAAASKMETVPEAMRVTGSVTRISSVVIALAILLSIGWAMVVRVPIHVSGYGLLVAEDGVLISTVPSTSSGLVAKVLVHKNQVVSEGARLATLRLTDREAELHKQERELTLLKSSTSDKEALLKSQTARKLATAEDTVVAQEERISILKSRRDRLVERQKTLAGLQSKGVVSQETLVNAHFTADEAEDALASAKAELIQKQTEIQTIKFSQANEILENRLEIERQEADLAATKEAIDKDSEVLADIAGKVVRINTRPGALVSSGETLFEITPRTEGTLKAVAYISMDEGKRLKQDDEVLLTPSSLPTDLHAQMIGSVAGISPLPISREALKQSIGDDGLIEMITAKGAVFEVWIDLSPSKNTASGYLWTSKEAEGLTLSSGTSFSASIRIEQRPLLALAIPALKRFLGEATDSWAGR
ncbi:NHLP bacteriocin system secretion protein [uncultured Cohaesibacter sp.]|uniref:NHLP bacteriocin system secretion protein n=1 Tax=uncultured Cohaesibacter sp. TaxID=1002546 RepID=UPI0029C7D39C|nr:NHLP bacteriocin system secretion protein [uncultured Cohaesibacter sp.]